MADLEKKRSISSGSDEKVQTVPTSQHHIEHVTQEEETLHRGLKARQISMIALGGAVGTGLIIGSGTALRRGGPLGILIGYSFVGFVCYCAMISLGEMSAYLPHKKGFAGYTTRFWHPAVGFALGWNYLMKYLIVTPNNLNAAILVINYWTKAVPNPAWMVIFILFIFLVNLLGIRVFGELEFWFSSIKVIALIALILFGIIVDLGGNPRHDRIGFRYWKEPYGPMGSYLLAETGNRPALAKFLGFWAVMGRYIDESKCDADQIGVTVGEAANPRKNIPRAIRRTFFRILVFYVGGVFVIGLIVPSTSQDLFIATRQSTGAAASPFVVAATMLGIRGLRHVINGAILIFVMSAANSDLYIGSRTLYGLALEGKAPKIFKRVNKMGVPWPALLFCTAFCFLVFLNTAKGASKVFGYFVNLVSTFGAITWMCILYTHIRFMKALKVQGISRDTLPYKAPFQPYGAWFALIATGIITFFKGFDTFIPTIHGDTFVTAYIGIPAFFIFLAFWKLRYRDHTIPYDTMDLVTGKKEIDMEEEAFLEAERARGPRTRWQKIWDSL
ncbi:putative DIP5-glutamate and aspartate permease [Serendipita vermifera]|nr:putative DIP5-glutamate and aspartate permease [Serendipita vermifera]